ncbi:hypothetical protein BOX15_Mlig007346g1 [Macrostomum lignano]|uniref:Sema domain-containing protein n=2 Tax=Macrostomum lignano TaxID=282301 RepID=A0A267EIZ0_9PLAT|nr:hypothetical protein BOX15_Mlig007346g1 [Macrostomum lignano]
MRPTISAAAVATASKRLLLLQSLLPLLTVLLLTSSRTSGLAFSDEATSYPGHSFSHMELYDFRGVEFLAVAQTNQLINMRADFSEKYITQIGPRNDSTVCSPIQMQPNIMGINKLKCQIHSMDNYIKAMTLHNGSLYFCMSYLSSSCAAAPLTDGPLSVNFTEIDRKLQHLSRSLLCRNEAAKTQLTVAPKYISSDTKSNNGLYLSMPFCSTKNLENTVESVISIVELKTLQLFRIGSFSAFHSEILPHNSKRRPNALSYHYSFKYTDGPHEYVYFLLTAREVVSSQFSQVRIGRLCTRDVYMTGYVEMHIYCSHADADPTATYGYIGEAAIFTKAGGQLAASLGIPATEPVLFLSSRVFDSSISNWHQGVCAVPISSINARLNRIVVDCLQGQAYFGPAYIRDPTKCPGRGFETQPAESDAPAPPQCTPFQPQPEWGGMVGLKEQHRYQTNFIASVDVSVNITSVAVLPLQNGATVLYIGTSAGELLHYSVLSQRQSYLFDNATVGSGPVLSIRTGRRRLFALTKTQVGSHPYASCEQRHLSCSACLGSRNPHCVWSNLAGAPGCRTWDRPGRPDPDSHVISAENCPTVASVNNADICVDKPRLERRVSVDLQLAHAPRVTYYCHYVADGAAVMPSREAELQGTYQLGGSLTVRCPVDMAELQLFLGSQASRRLSVQVTGSRASPQPYYASVDAEAFSCHLHSSCTSCTAGGGRRRLCSWCSLQAACVHQPSIDCPDDVGRSAVANGTTGGSCPLVGVGNGATADDREIAQPSGTSARLVYNLSGYKSFMQSFSCSVACPGSEAAEYPASLLDAQPESAGGSRRLLECRTGILQRQQQPAAATLLCSVVFHWSDRTGGKHVVEPAVASASRLLLYHCQSMAASCDDCTLGIQDDRFSCVWCPTAALPAQRLIIARQTRL